MSNGMDGWMEKRTYQKKKKNEEEENRTSDSSLCEEVI